MGIDSPISVYKNNATYTYRHSADTGAVFVVLPKIIGGEKGRGEREERGKEKDSNREI